MCARESGAGNKVLALFDLPQHSKSTSRRTKNECLSWLKLNYTEIIFELNPKKKLCQI
jgi:hypothetical protein